MTPKALAKKEDGDRIVDFEVSEDRRTVDITECCDNYFGATLTKAEFGEFIAELQALQSSMAD